MAKPELQDNPGCVAHFFAAVIIAFITIGCLYTYGEVISRYECVEMPNGFLLGRATFSSEMTGDSKNTVLKFPDGHVLLRGNPHSILFWDEDSFGGTYRHGPKPSDREAFIYVLDVGFISEKRKPNLYQKYFDLKREQGTIVQMSADHSLNSAYMGLYFNTQIENGNDWRGDWAAGELRHKYRKDWCPTDWFEPEIVDLESILAE